VLDPLAVTAVLRGGPATLDALAARLGGPAREDLAWALDDALGRGWIAAPAADCGPDGVCSTAPPAVYRLTDGGRTALGRPVTS
jgi:hypothetical protein